MKEGKKITWLQLLSVEGALFGGTARTSRTTGEMASHLRHFQELRAELSRGGLLSGTTRMNHTTSEIASN